MTYLDHNATAPVRPDVMERMREVMALPANASSVHAAGRRAREWVEQARDTLAQMLSVFPAEITFTASGTEANNWALVGVKDVVPVVSAIEHPSILKAAAHVSPETVHVPVHADGILDLEALEKTLHALTSNEQRATRNALVSIMLANNETGVIQPVAEAVKIARKYNAWTHTDATQAFGKIPVDMGLLGVDMLTLSAHKLGGPQGAAALVVREGIPLQPRQFGGGQERGRRAGTENVAAIAGFALAAELSQTLNWYEVRQWHTALEKTISYVSSNILVAGAGADRLPNTSNIIMPGVSSETQLIYFDLAGFAVSAGSACSSGRIEPSHVLKAMGIAEAGCAVRVSSGWDTKEQDLVTFAESWKALFARHDNALPSTRNAAAV